MEIERDVFYRRLFMLRTTAVPGSLRKDLAAANAGEIWSVKYLLRLDGEEVVVAEVLYPEAGLPTYVWHGEAAQCLVSNKAA
jgi:hypothetical protein